MYWWCKLATGVRFTDRHIMAARMGTTQSVVARIVSGRGTRSIRTVQRFASAVVRVPWCALSL